MKIHIRPRYVKCPCGGKYIKVSKDRYVCDNCDNENPSHYYLEFYYGNKQIFLYSDERGRALDTLTRAKYLVDDIQFEIKNGTFSVKRYTKVKNIRVASLLDKYLEEKLKVIAPANKSPYKIYVNTAKKFFGGYNIRNINKEDVIKYKEEIEKDKPNLGKGSLKNYLNVFKTFLFWCKEKELLQIIPPFPRIDIPDKPTKWYNQADQVKILEAIPDLDKPIVMFCMRQGVRPAEARALKIKDVDLNNLTILIHATFSGNVYREQRKGRGAKSLLMPIHPDVFPYIKERCKSSLPDAWVYPNPETGDFYGIKRWYKIWGIAKKKLGVKELKPYVATRHSFASQLVNAGVSIHTVSKLLGHSDISMTERYAHQHLETMREAITKVGSTNVVGIRTVQKKD